MLFIITIIIYIIAAASETWLINFMKSLYGIQLPIFFSILNNSSWPIQLIYYNTTTSTNNNNERKITLIMYRNYIIIGILASIVSITKLSGLTTLPPIIYAIASNTEIVFETILTKIFLNRNVSYLQLISVNLVIISIIISVYNPITNTWGDNDDSISNQTLLIGLLMTITSRFASSLNSILADKYLKLDTKSWLGCLEITLANSLIPFILLPIILIFIPEYQYWNELTYYYNNNNIKSTLIITLICILLSINKYADRISKYTIIGKRSTLFFAAIDANMKVVTGIGSFIFFNEEIYWPQILGFILIVIALIIMYLDRYITIKNEIKYQMLANDDNDYDKNIYVEQK